MKFAMKFIGREQELTLLKGFIQQAKAHLVVIRGRRRIGKSRLVCQLQFKSAPNFRVKVHHLNP